MSEDKKAFLLYQNYQKQFDMLTDEQAGRLIKSLFRYSENGAEPELDAVTAILFSLIADTLDRDRQKWESVREQRRQAGRKSAEARAERKSAKGTNADFVQQDVTNSTSVHFAQRSSANSTVKEKENVNVIVTGSVIEKKKEVKKRFVPPTLAELQEYVLEKGYHFSAEAFHAFYNSKGWLVGKSPMRSWKSACVTWESRELEKGTVNERIGIEPDFDRSQYQD